MLTKTEQLAAWLNGTNGIDIPPDPIYEWWVKWFEMIDNVESTVEDAKANAKKIEEYKEAL